MKKKRLLYFVFIALVLCYVSLLCGRWNLFDKGSKYIFTPEEGQTYFIVKLHNYEDKDLKSRRTTFDFSARRLITLKNGNYQISKKDSVFIKTKEGALINFDPNDTNENAFKLCYFQNTIGNGISVDYYAEKYGVKLSRKFRDFHLKYDLLYFRVGKKCSTDSLQSDDDELSKLLVEYFSEIE